MESLFTYLLEEYKSAKLRIFDFLFENKIIQITQ